MEKVVSLLSNLNEVYFDIYGHDLLRVELQADVILVNCVSRRSRNDLFWILCNFLRLNVDIVDITRLKISFS